MFTAFPVIMLYLLFLTPIFLMEILEHRYNDDVWREGQSMLNCYSNVKP